MSLEGSNENIGSSKLNRIHASDDLRGNHNLVLLFFEQTLKKPVFREPVEFEKFSDLLNLLTVL